MYIHLLLVCQGSTLVLVEPTLNQRARIVKSAFQEQARIIALSSIRSVSLGIFRKTYANDMIPDWRKPTHRVTAIRQFPLHYYLT